jgi:hypothetical protein
MKVGEFYDDAKKIFGVSDKTVIYRRLTDAINLIANESDWDELLGYMTIAVDEDGLITLPYDVDKPLALNVDGFPTFPRSKWFEYHLNGPGAYSYMDFYKSMWDDKGLSPLVRKITTPFFPSISSTDSADNTLSIRIYGVDENENELMTGNEKGLLVQIGTTASVKAMDITRIDKPDTVGVVSIKDGTVLYGEYQPFESEPMYKRIKVPAKSTITMMYRRRLFEVKSDNDFIFINRLSLLAACRSMKYRETERLDLAFAQQQDAIYLASKEQEKRDVQDGIGFQTINFSSDVNESLYDDYSSYGGGGCC